MRLFTLKVKPFMRFAVLRLKRGEPFGDHLTYRFLD